MEAPDLSDKLTALMPQTGNASTIEGEIVRAYCKIGYRYYNDGDRPYEGYGAETSGPALLFLQRLEYDGKFDEIKQAADNLTHAPFEDYLKALGDLINEKLMLRLKDLTENVDNVDMFDYQEEAIELWGDDEGEEEDEYCSECGYLTDYGDCSNCEGEES